MAVHIKTAQEHKEFITELKEVFNFKELADPARIAIHYTFQKEIIFDIENLSPNDSKGQEYPADTLLKIGDKKDGAAIYKAIFEVLYQRKITNDIFFKLLKCHIDEGLRRLKSIFKEQVNYKDYAVENLVNITKDGLDLIADYTPAVINSSELISLKSYNGLVEFSLGKNEDDEEKIIQLNKDFEPQHIAIAGMTRSGKTQLMQHILHEISKSTNNQLKYIFFDFKGEGQSEGLNKFLESTQTNFIDLQTEPFLLNPLCAINNDNDRERVFTIQSFVDSIIQIAPKLGEKQEYDLKRAIKNAFETSDKKVPSLLDVYNELNEIYTEKNKDVDTLSKIIEEISEGIFTDAQDTSELFRNNIYLNLPATASDTFRKIVVMLTLNYLFQVFNRCEQVSQNDEGIKPMRYMIVIDEAHVYMQDAKARKMVEKYLRLISSKGVSICLLSQGVEDYKYKDFDFVSQVKLSICANIQNKELRGIKGFLGTPKNEAKLKNAITKLETEDQVKRAVININEPEVIQIHQFWNTILKEPSLN